MNEKEIIKQLINFSDREKLIKISEIVFPIDSKKDMDGDWYDVNHKEREGFLVGVGLVLEQCGIEIK